MLVPLIAAGAALAWLASYVGCVALTGIGPRGGRPVPGQLPDAPPALVNLVVTGARLDGAAYPATILDLAAQGQLVITETGPGALCCALPHTSPAGARLAGPLSAGAFGAFLPACCVWGIAGQDRLSRAGADLAAQAATVGAATLAGAPGGWPPGSTGSGSTVSGSTVSGSTVSPGVLRQLAVAVAGHVPVPLAGAGPGEHIGVRLGGARSPAAIAGKPAAGWSSMTGEWRLVPIRPPGIPRYRNPFRLLGLAGAAALVLAWLGWLGPAGLLTDPLHVVPLILVLLLAAAGLLALAGYLARPAQATFPAQVIACWTEDRGKQETVLVYCYAVDDGRQTWCGEASEADFARLRAGDMIQVRAAPRRQRLTGLDLTRP
jgi:hypothetical protein